MEIMSGDNKSQDTQDKDVLLARERRKTTEGVGVVAFLVALCGFGVLLYNPTWPGAIGVVSVFIAISYISSKMLK